MKNILVTFFAVVLLCSCQKDLTKPNPFIEESKMENILYDITLLYGAQNTNSFVLDTVRAMQMEDVFKKYEIDSLSFAENSRYYIAQKKGVYFKMQTRVMERLKKEQERIDTLISKKIAPLELKQLTDTLTPSITPDTLAQSTVAKEIKKEKIEVKKQKEFNPTMKKRLQQQIKLQEVKE